MTPQNTIPQGLCQCGCGRKTKITTQNDRRAGYLKGEPRRFCIGHGRKVVRDNPLPGMLDGKEVSYIALTRGQAAIVDREDFEKLSAYSWTAHHVKITNTYYAMGRVAGRATQMHRMVLNLGAGDGRIGEHRNGNSLDNRKSNLRFATGRPMLSTGVKTLTAPVGLRALHGTSKAISGKLKSSLG